MATATLVFHGELVGFLARERRSLVAFDLNCARAATVKNAIESVGVPHTEVGWLMVNGERATLSRTVREGDRIEVGPHNPTEGVAEGEALRFVADAHLGGLARFLRMLGFDTLYDNAFSDRRIVDLAVSERRIVLTRDRGLLKCRDVARGCYVHERKPELQLREVAQRYSLEPRAHPFTLCLCCNLKLRTLRREGLHGRVPDAIIECYDDFMSCPACERVYWPGSHWGRMSAMLEARLPAFVQRADRPPIA
jgi:uncharacterized protein with PIN domain